MLSINALAAEKSIEVCKNISKVADLYACDVGPSVVIVSKGNLIASIPKSAFQTTEHKK